MFFFKNKFHAIATASLLGFLVIAVCIHFESVRFPYIGAVLKHNGDMWIVHKVDVSGKAAEEGVRPGDRVLAVDGRPAKEYFSESPRISLVKVSRAVLLRNDGSIYEMHVETELEDVGKIIFSIVAEGLLLGIGLIAYLKNPGSSIVRKFAAMNLVMALIVLALYSTEILLSDLILSLCSIWLPYLLLSFCISFVLRVKPPVWKKLLSAFRLFCLLFLAYTIYAIAGEEIPSWIRETVQLVFILSLLVIAGAVRLYWKTLDSIEKNHALALVFGLYLSLLPYIFLYAIPDLLGGNYIIAPEYALMGLIPLSGTMMVVLGKRSLLDMRIYVPRLLIHSLYYGCVLMLFLAAVRLEEPAWSLFPFGLFAGLTCGYRKCLQWSRQGAEKRKEWLEQQKLRLSIQMAETQNIHDILSMLGEMIHSIMEVDGVCIIWYDGARISVHGTGRYNNVHMEGVEDDKWLDQEFLKGNFSFEYLAPIARESNETGMGFLCVGPKSNSSLLSVEERGLLDSIRTETLRLLMNAGHLSRLQKQYQQSKNQNAAYEQSISDIRWFNRQLLEAQQSERIRTSYYLHDHLLQNLIFLSRDLEEAAGQEHLDKGQAAAWLKCLYDSQRDIRLLCDELYPHIVDMMGLEEALHWLLRDLQQKGGLETVLHYDWKPQEPLEPVLKSNLFRMIRELTNNVVKHAKASRLEIRLWQESEGEICCTVSDNGRGFEAASFYEHRNAMEHKHLGLVSVSNQITYLDGAMDIRSVPGKGTVITLKLRQKEENDG